LLAIVWPEASIELRAQQLAAFDEQGYLFMPSCFSEEEIALLRAEAEVILKSDRQEVWREKAGAPRTAFAAHTFSDVFHLLACHPRLIEPLVQYFGEPVYVHQFKLNAKAAFEGDVWQWHQDYGTWARDDGMPEPRAMNIAVFLDEVMPINGPLLLIPKSHRQGVLSAGHDKATTSYPLWTLDAETVTRLAADAAGPDGIGIVAPTGKPGSVLMFHGNLVHASPPNITPYPRKIVYLTLCAVSNHITKFTRPEWIAHRDFAPIVPVTDKRVTGLWTRTPRSRPNRS
jgi:ectoine hydroxylase